ncbi:PREDICTED: UDP-glycosyltransferase 79B8-like [Camelina sativa]|uniref:UDP-glycosyltransferase 79B8-like n=1 Tax=Camelina sativa TaxID=90675 RepID=A0ABM0VFG3_CAMSA|nr:PREDICTED: UDP-glycosyltransferase 79B8-like [Camelina sativa]
MEPKFHAFMFPWFAFVHMIPFLHLANKLAEKGHRVTFLLPKKAQKQLEHHNLFPDRIVFHPLAIPHVNGLPAGAETTSDISISMDNFLSEALDLTRDQVEAAVRALRPDLIFFDFAHWIPEVAKEHMIKSVSYMIASATAVAHSHAHGSALGVIPPGYPSSKVFFRGNDAHTMSTFFERVCHLLTIGFKSCDVIALRTCKEIEGKFCDYISSQYQKKVILTGPMLPELDTSKPLDEHWSQFPSGFPPGSVVFCAFGNQTVLEKDQFQELCLGLELTGLPFLLVVNPPRGSSTVQEGLPEEFEERVKGRGEVWGGWVQQPLILSHPSVGCFVNHCGPGTIWECLMTDCQMVLIPYIGDQVLFTRLLTEEFEVSVEVSREKTGWFSKESLRDAIKSVMDKESDVGKLVRSNHAKLKEILVSPGLFAGYVDNFVEALADLISVKKHD